jgi:hypothetical protein
MTPRTYWLLWALAGAITVLPTWYLLWRILRAVEGR